MDNKKFRIVRIIIILVTIFSLIYIHYYQEKIIKEEKIIEEKRNITEDIVIDASKLYISNNQDYFSEMINEKDFEIRINTDDLVKEKLIDNNNGFKGYVKVINNEFSFVKIDDMLIDNINAKDYVTGINNENNAYDLKYIYKGDNPNNYIKYNDKLYRIIGITNSNNLKVISVDTSVEEYFGLSGDINYLKTDKEINSENKGIFYVGYIRSETSEIDQIMKNEKRNNTYTINNPKLYYDYSYVNISDIVNASNECNFKIITDINTNNCNSYLLNMLSNTYSSNTLENNLVYKINENGEVVTSKIENNFNIKKIIYISLLNEYKSGDGTKENPYEIK